MQALKRFVLVVIYVVLLYGMSIDFEVKPVRYTQNVTLPPIPDGWVRHNYDDVLWLARNVYFEARGEPEEGQYAVAFVTINRFASGSKDFDTRSITSVVTQKRRGVCQFTWFCHHNPVTDIHDPVAWQRALTVAQRALRGEVPNPIGNALYYHVASPTKDCVCIGAHTFLASL